MKRPPDDEAALFRESVRDVKRLRAHDAPASRKKPPPQARTPSRPESAPPRSAPTVSRRQLRELRRGGQRAQDALDLHGLTVVRAERALHDFLASAVRRGLTCIRIVHGKGHHSGSEGPVLKTLVEAVLRAAPEVRAFTSAPPRQGGTGAVNVLLGKG